MHRRIHKMHRDFFAMFSKKLFARMNRQCFASKTFASFRRTTFASRLLGLSEFVCCIVPYQRPPLQKTNGVSFSSGIFRVIPTRTSVCLQCYVTAHHEN